MKKKKDSEIPYTLTSLCFFFPLCTKNIPGNCGFPKDFALHKGRKMLEFMMVWWKGPLRTFLISSSSLKEEIFHGKNIYENQTTT